MQSFTRLPTIWSLSQQLLISSQPDHPEDIDCVCSSYSLQWMFPSTHSSPVPWGFGISFSVPSLWIFKQRLPLMITHQLHVKRSSVFKLYISCFYLRCNCLGRHMYIIALKFENTQFAEWRTHRKKKKKNPRGKSVQDFGSWEWIFGDNLYLIWREAKK